MEENWTDYLRYKTGFTNGIGIIGKKQRIIIPEHNPSLADIIQDDVKKQEEKNEQNYEDQCYQRNRIQVKN